MTDTLAAETPLIIRTSTKIRRPAAVMIQVGIDHRNPTITLHFTTEGAMLKWLRWYSAQSIPTVPVECELKKRKCVNGKAP